MDIHSVVVLQHDVINVITQTKMLKDLEDKGASFSKKSTFHFSTGTFT